MSETIHSRRSLTHPIQDFRGNFEDLAALVQRAWGENSKQSLFYTADFLASAFDYPGANFSLAPTLYFDLKPVAFAAGFPRTVKFKGQNFQIVVSSFLSVSNEYKKKGYGVVLWSELVRRVRDLGYDGMVNYCVDGEPMNRMILGCCQRLKLPTGHIHEIRYMSKLLQSPEVVDSVATIDADFVGGFLRSVTPIVGNVPLSRIWTEKEIEWQCNRRSGAVVARHSWGTREGILSGYVMPVANQQRTKCLLIEDVLWGTLEAQERQVLLTRLLDQAAAQGAQMAVVPRLGYANMEPFRLARFSLTRRVLHSYLTLWAQAPSIEALSAMYLDVF